MSRPALSCPLAPLPCAARRWHQTHWVIAELRGPYRLALPAQSSRVARSRFAFSRKGARASELPSLPEASIFALPRARSCRAAA